MNDFAEYGRDIGAVSSYMRRAMPVRLGSLGEFAVNSKGTGSHQNTDSPALLLGFPVTTLPLLHERYQSQFAQQRTPFSLRMRRALSWLQRAEAAGQDDDVAFICLWIAFNAAYAQDANERDSTISERQAFRDFIGDVCRLDSNKALSALAWQVFPGPIRVLLNNQYVFQPFWNALNNPRSDGSIPDDWQEQFDEARKRVERALAQEDTERVWYEVLIRLYTLRNQLMHGGATWNSSVNRAQVKDGRALLSRMLPVMLEVMLNHPARFEGKPFYPVVSH